MAQASALEQQPAVTQSPRPGPLGRLGGWAYRNRGKTVLAWIAVLVLAGPLSAADAAEHSGFTVALGGQSIQQAEQGQIGSEGIGLAAAAIILLLTFGSVVAAGLPIIVAVSALAVSGLLTGLIAAVIDVPDWST